MKFTVLPLFLSFLPTPILSQDDGNDTTIIPNLGQDLATAGFNREGGSVFTNYDNIRKDGQYFALRKVRGLYEKPGSEPVEGVFVDWFADIEVLQDDIGYVGRGMHHIVENFLESAAQAGAQTYNSSSWRPLSVGSVYVPHSNIFEGFLVKSGDDSVFRFWDDGTNSSKIIIWEGHDEGDQSPNSQTSAFAFGGSFQWISVDDAAAILGYNVSDLTPETFKVTYEAAWNERHPPINSTTTTSAASVGGRFLNVICSAAIMLLLQVP